MHLIVQKKMKRINYFGNIRMSENNKIDSKDSLTATFPT